MYTYHLADGGGMRVVRLDYSVKQLTTLTYCYIFDESEHYLNNILVMDMLCFGLESTTRKLITPTNLIGCNHTRLLSLFAC